MATRATPAFRDFLNHELRTPLTAAGTALQTLALQLERAGGPSLDLVDIALRNVRRLEQTVEWACDYVLVDSSAVGCDSRGQPLTDLLEDIDDLEPQVELTWSTGMGDWQTRVDRCRATRWRRLLRQMLRAVGYRQADPRCTST